KKRPIPKINKQKPNMIFVSVMYSRYSRSHSRESELKKGLRLAKGLITSSSGRQPRTQLRRF
ncbi:hypothetical protein ACQP3J_34105, partial [Escherichia coli]